MGCSLTLFRADLHAQGDDDREGLDGALPGDGADRPDTGGAGGGQGWQEEVHSPRHRQLLLALPQGGRRHLLRGLSQTQGERGDTVGCSLTLFCADLHAKGDDGREGPDGALPGDGADQPDTGGVGGEGRGVKRRHTPRDTDVYCCLCSTEEDVLCCEACPR